MTYFTSESVVPKFINKKRNKVFFSVLSILSGVFLIGVLAQISIPLPWTPVPITGQTFGVLLVALSWGRKFAVSTFIAYLSLGALGAPVFAMGKSGLIWGPTLGYLFGMFLSCFVVGFLADVGFTKSLFKSLLAAFAGSVVIFTSGLVILSFYIPKNNLLEAGLYPFLLGDILKNSLAAYISWQLKMRTD